MNKVIEFEDAIQSIERKEPRSGKAYLSRLSSKRGEIVIFPGIRREYLSEDDLGSDPSRRKRQA